ncbi:MAG TPA: zinc-dependent alcohol dehydrogenase family protein [Acetobacteraceae bacterium]|nr:zinc-dependent alcohol dehydrogenase family protein [Acetobacteraceae bacterium]
MIFMRLDPSARLLRRCDEPAPPLNPLQIAIQITACGVCRTDLHVVDGELPDVRAGIVPGHEIVGRVVARGEGAHRFELGARVGVPWLGWVCGVCEFCRRGQENLCPNARFTGYQIDGGYADQTVAHEDFCVPIPDAYDDATAAPLLCAGLIGYRTWKMAGPAGKLGIYGFGAAGHIVAQLARHRGQQVFAFTRAGDDAAQQFARRLGAVWAGAGEEMPPEKLDAALIFAPVGALVPAALAAVRDGGTVVCGGIHMSDIPAFPYRLLWGERVLRSVANLTRADAAAFLPLAVEAAIRPETSLWKLAQANEALTALREGTLTGAAVLTP